MMNMHKPATENAYQKAERVPDNFLYLFEKERSWGKQIVDILYRDVWADLKPGVKHMMFIQTQSFLGRVYDNVKIPDGLCLDVYGRLSRVTTDWLPESNEIKESEYENYKATYLSPF